MTRAKALQYAHDTRARIRLLAFGSVSLATLISIIIGPKLTGALLAAV